MRTRSGGSAPSRRNVLPRLILFGETSLLPCADTPCGHIFITREYHQGKDNLLLFPAGSPVTAREGPIQCRERLVGLLKYYTTPSCISIVLLQESSCPTHPFPGAAHRPGCACLGAIPPGWSRVRRHRRTTLVLRASQTLQDRFETLLAKRKAGTLSPEEPASTRRSATWTRR